MVGWHPSHDGDGGSGITVICATLEGRGGNLAYLVVLTFNLLEIKECKQKIKKSTSINTIKTDIETML